MVKTNKYFVIVNPAANRGGAAMLIPKLESLFNSKKMAYNLVITKAPEQAIDLAKQAASQDYPIVIAAGGDGTVNEVANGLAGSQTAMGVIPMGSGNDFSKMLALRKTDWEFDLDVILKEKIKKIDLGMMNCRYFASQTSMGFTGRVNNYVKKSPPFLKGYSMFIYSVLKILINYYPHHFKITMQDKDNQIIEREGDYTICDVGNCRFQGDGFQITPQAVMDDGWLDVCLVDTVSRSYILRLLPKVMQGKHIGEPPVHMFRVKKITIESDKIIPLHFDGEPNNKYKKVEIKIAPKVLKVVTNE